MQYLNTNSLEIVLIKGNWRRGQKYYYNRKNPSSKSRFCCYIVCFDQILLLKIFYFLYSIELVCLVFWYFKDILFYRARFFSPAPWCSIIGVVVFQRYSIFGILQIRYLKMYSCLSKKIFYFRYLIELVCFDQLQCFRSAALHSR